MANAAKKKLNQAKKQAASLYKPLLLTLNAIYVVIRVIAVYNGRAFSVYDLGNSCICWGFMYYAYLGICEDFANQAGWNKGSSGTALAGGSSLDLLAFTVLVQFGSLWNGKVWYGLLAIPISIGYKMYTTFRGTLGGLLGSSAAVEESAAETKNKGSIERRKIRRTDRGKAN